MASGKQHALDRLGDALFGSLTTGISSELAFMVRSRSRRARRAARLDRCG